MLAWRRSDFWSSRSFRPKLSPRRESGSGSQEEVAKEGEFRKVLRRGIQQDIRRRKGKHGQRLLSLGQAARRAEFQLPPGVTRTRPWGWLSEMGAEAGWFLRLCQNFQPVSMEKCMLSFSSASPCSACEALLSLGQVEATVQTAQTGLEVGCILYGFPQHPSLGQRGHFKESAQISTF